MKNINKILTIAFGAGALLTTQSCKEEFLDVDHYDVLSADYIASSDKTFEDGLLACYANMNQLINGDSMKPWLWLSGHPTMDTQATGWDKAWLTQEWPADQQELYDEWKRLYDGISLCNKMLEFCQDAANTTNISKEMREQTEAEAKAMRGFYYFLAAQTWGNIPIMELGQTFEDLPGNGGEEGNAVAVLDYIIKDLTDAAAKLDWKPRNNQYGRATKGMAKAFLAEAYLWKAYRQGNPSGPGTEVDAAKKELEDIINSGTYALQESFTTLFDPLAWNKESIWEEVMEEGSTKAWEGFHTNAHGWTDNYAACPDNGGWGTLYLSWEWYTCYEKGDKRRDGSACVPTIDNWGNYKDRITGEPLEQTAKSDYCYGVNPYLSDVSSKYKSYHYNTGGDYAPSCWSLKWWRTGKNTWWSNMWNPVHIYWKRYADVLLTYAECCFRTEGANSSKGWEYVNMVRKRAFGDLEAGQEANLTTKYAKYYHDYAAADHSQLWGGTYDVDKFEDENGNLKYPIPFGSNMADYQPGETYYADVKSKLGFNLETWQVAMIQERRKEFNCEWTLAPALHREGLLAEHIRCNYPPDATSIGENLYTYPWTPRKYEYSEEKMNFPIPAQELLRNPNLTQNKAYR